MQGYLDSWVPEGSLAGFCWGGFLRSGRPRGAREGLQKCGGLRPPHFARLSRAAGAGQTSKRHPPKSAQIAFRYPVWREGGQKGVCTAAHRSSLSLSHSISTGRSRGRIPWRVCFGAAGLCTRAPPPPPSVGLPGKVPGLWAWKFRMPWLLGVSGPRFGYQWVFKWLPWPFPAAFRPERAKVTT